MWRMGGGYRGRKGGSTLDRGGGQRGSRRDPNAIDIDRSRGEDRTCYVCGKWGHMAKNCWERHKERVVETLQESAKENGGQWALGWPPIMYTVYCAQKNWAIN